MRSHIEKAFRRRLPAAALALMVGLFPSATSALGEVCTVNASKLNVRSAPSTDSAVITVVRRGAELPLLETTNSGWFKVEVNGQVGYVSAEYASVSNGATAGSSAGAQTTPSQTPVSQAGGTGVVTADKLNVRSGPSTSSQAIGRVARGTALTVTGRSGDWLQISYNGASAYVAAAYVSLGQASGGSLSAGSTASSAPASSTATPSAITASLLREGSKGDDVRALQQKLIALGYLSGAADGIFGPGTRSAVKAFQRANGLDADGVAGAQTIAALNGGSATSSAPTQSTAPTSTAGQSENVLKMGSRGSDVKAMQQKLIALGYLNDVADGVFGRNTERAVIAFQAANGLTANGEAGADTQAAIQQAAPAQSGSSSANNGSNAAQTSSSNLTGMASQAVTLTNTQRAAHGLNSLTVDSDLTAAALIRANEIVAQFGHTRPDGNAWYTVSDKAAGENLAYGTIESAEEVVTGWMNSEGHRANILDDTFKTVGIACIQVNGLYYWVQIFGR